MRTLALLALILVSISMLGFVLGQNRSNQSNLNPDADFLITLMTPIYDITDWFLYNVLMSRADESKELNTSMHL